MSELKTDSEWKPYLGGGEGADPLATCVSASFTHDGSWYAAATANGPVFMSKIETSAYPSSSDKNRFATFNPTGLGDAATTNVKFRTQSASTVSNSYLVATAVSSGCVELWNFNPELATRKVRSLGAAVEAGNETLALSFAPDGNSLVTAGSDKCIRIYAVGDLSSNNGSTSGSPLTAPQPLKLVAEYRSGINSHGQDTLGPNNRIFSLKHITSNTFLAAGWETPVLLYDTRIAKSAQGAIRGPHVSGDSLDISEGGHTLVVGSDRNDGSQLDVYDLRNLGAAFSQGQTEVPEPTKPVASVSGVGTRIFAARFSPHGKQIWASGAERNQVLVYNWNGSSELSLKSKTEELPHPIYCLDHNDKVRPRHANPAAPAGEAEGESSSAGPSQFRCSWIGAGAMGYTVRVPHKDQE